MSTWFASGKIIDAILALMLIESLVLYLIKTRTGRGLPPKQIATLLISGMALMLAVRAALVGADWPIIAACLAAGGVAHVADIKSRWTS